MQFVSHNLLRIECQSISRTETHNNRRKESPPCYRLVPPLELAAITSLCSFEIPYGKIRKVMRRLIGATTHMTSVPSAFAAVNQSSTWLCRM